MIKLKVEDRCHKCPLFRPEMEVEWNNYVQNRIIVCKNKASCLKLEQHMLSNR